MKKFQKQERRVAASSGGKVRPGSGSRWFAPSDVKCQKYLISCKTTDKKSFSLKQQHLDEIKEDAFFEDKVPIMKIDFGGKSVWVVEEQYVQFNDETGEITIS